MHCSTSLTAATPLLSAATSQVLGISDSIGLTIGILVIIAVIYTLAVWFGMKGISKMAKWCMYTERYHTINEVVDSLTNDLSVHGAAERNFRAWPSWGVYIWPNYYTSVSYTDEIHYLKNWINKRIAW